MLIIKNPDSQIKYEENNEKEPEGSHPETSYLFWSVLSGREEKKKHTHSVCMCAMSELFMESTHNIVESLGSYK